MANLTKSSSIFLNPACPQLPSIDLALPITHTRAHRIECSSAYHTSCLELAQSLWRSGSPAQAILQLDKSMMAQSIEMQLPVPYAAILWIIQHSPADQFLGNPVRHFQHLASRMNMSQPNAELRIWRAWACLHITEANMPAGMYPRDLEQMEREALEIPTLEEALTQFSERSLSEELDSIKLLIEPSTSCSNTEPLTRS